MARKAPRGSRRDGAAAKRIRLERATDADAAAIAWLRTAVADDLKSTYGPGHWALRASEKGVLTDLQTSAVFVARSRSKVVATLRLATRKPWAIDTTYDDGG